MRYTSSTTGVLRGRRPAFAILAVALVGSLVAWHVAEDRANARDRELAAARPGDQARVALAHDTYDKAIDRASRIYERYETRAWRSYRDAAEALRVKYGVKVYIV